MNWVLCTRNSLNSEFGRTTLEGRRSSLLTGPGDQPRPQGKLDGGAKQWTCCSKKLCNFIENGGSIDERVS